MKEAVSVFMQRRRRRGRPCFWSGEDSAGSEPAGVSPCCSDADQISVITSESSHISFSLHLLSIVSPAPLTAHCVHDTKSFLQRLFDRGQSPELLPVLSKERRESKWSQWKVDSSGRAKETRQRLWLRVSYHQLNVCFPPPRSSVLPRAPTFCLTWGKIHMNFLSQKIVFFVNFDTQ